MKFEIAHERPRDEQKVTMWLETDPQGRVRLYARKHSYGETVQNVVLADISENGIQLWTSVDGHGIAVDSKNGARMKIIT